MKHRPAGCERKKVDREISWLWHYAHMHQNHVKTFTKTKHTIFQWQNLYQEFIAELALECRGSCNTRNGSSKRELYPQLTISSLVSELQLSSPWYLNDSTGDRTLHFTTEKTSDANIDSTISCDYMNLFLHKWGICEINLKTSKPTVYSVVSHSSISISSIL